MGVGGARQGSAEGWRPSSGAGSLGSVAGSRPGSVGGSRQGSARGWSPSASGGVGNAQHSALPGCVEVDLSDLVLGRFRRVMLFHGGPGGIHRLGWSLRAMNPDTSRPVSAGELHSALQDYGLHMGPKDLRLLLAAADDGRGSCNVDDFLAAVRGTISRRRLDIIHMAFDAVDRSGDGVASVQDLQSVFSASHHAELLQGNVSEADAFGHFLEQFDSLEREGVVTRGEFASYYASVSASIDDDDYFEDVVCGTWRIPRGGHRATSMAGNRVLARLVDGDQRVVMLDSNSRVNVHDFPAVISQLKAQGVTNVIGYAMAN